MPSPSKNSLLLCGTALVVAAAVLFMKKKKQLPSEKKSKKTAEEVEVEKAVVDTAVEMIPVAIDEKYESVIDTKESTSEEMPAVVVEVDPIVTSPEQVTEVVTEAVEEVDGRDDVLVVEPTDKTAPSRDEIIEQSEREQPSKREQPSVTPVSSMSEPTIPFVNTKSTTCLLYTSPSPRD